MNETQREPSYLIPVLFFGLFSGFLLRSCGDEKVQTPHRDLTTYKLRTETLEARTVHLTKYVVVPHPNEMRIQFTERGDIYSLYYGYGITDNEGSVYRDNEVLSLILEFNSSHPPPLEFMVIPLASKSTIKVYDILELRTPELRFTRYAKIK